MSSGSEHLPESAMNVFEARVSIDRSPDVVWDVLTDATSWREWYGGALERVDPRWTVGALLRWELGGPSEIRELVPRRSLSFGGGTGSLFAIEIERSGPGTSIVTYRQAVGSGFVVTDPSAIQNRCQQVAEGLKRFTEENADRLLPAAEQKLEASAPSVAGLRDDLGSDVEGTGDPETTAAAPEAPPRTIAGVDRGLAWGISAGGLVAIVGWVLSLSGRIPSPEDKVMLALGVGVAAGGAVLSRGTDRHSDRVVAWLALIGSSAALGLALDVKSIARPGLGPYLLLVGPAIAAAGGGWSVARRLGRHTDRPDRLDEAVLAVGGVAVAVSSALPWIAGRSGSQLPWGRSVLGLGIAIALLGGLALATRGPRASAVLWPAATVVAMAAAGMAIDLGLRFDSGFVQVGLYLLIVPGLLAAAAGAAGVATSLGLPRPSFPGRLVAAFTALGVLGLVLGFGMTDTVQQAGGSPFAIRLAACLLLAIGGGMAARRAWAWFLGFPVSALFLTNGVIGFFSQSGRGFNGITILVYGNLLNVLWRSRGYIWTDRPSARKASPVPEAGPEPPAPATVETPPAAVVPAVQEPPPVEPTFRPTPPPAEPGPVTPGWRLSRPLVALLGVVALGAVAVTAYSLGRGGAEPAPSPAVANPPTGGVEQSPSVVVQSPVGETTAPPAIGSVTVVNASSTFNVRGCAIDLIWHWVVDPSTAPPLRSEAFIQVTGPQTPGVFVAPLTKDGVTLRLKAGLLHGGGTWSATLVTLGDQPVGYPPIELTYLPKC